MMLKKVLEEYYNFHKELIIWIRREKMMKINTELSDIHYRCHIPASTVCHHKGLGVVIGSGVKLGENVHIYQNVTLGSRGGGAEGFPVIDDNVIIFAGASVLGGVKVGHDSIIGAYSLVLNDIPPHSVAFGIPAKIVKEDNKNRLKEKK